MSLSEYRLLMMRSITRPTSAWNSNDSFSGSALASAVASAMRRRMALAEFRRAKVAGRELMPTDDDEEGGACSPGETKAATEAAEKRAQRAAPEIFMAGFG